MSESWMLPSHVNMAMGNVIIAGALGKSSMVDLPWPYLRENHPWDGFFMVLKYVASLTTIDMG